MTDKEIIALVRLLEDEDAEVSEIVSKKLVEKGMEAVPDLEKARMNSYNPSFQVKIEEIVHIIRFTNVKADIHQWIREGYGDLLYGAYLISKYQYPNLQFSEIESEIEIIRRLAWVEFHQNLTALEKIRIINHIFFDIYKFSGNATNFYAPGNSYINQVLETKKGNPIALSVIYSVVSRKLGLPVNGVNLPLNYLLAYEDPLYHEDPNGVLFYINPYNRGIVLGRKEIDFFLKEQKLEPKSEYYKPCNNLVTIERMLKNLQFSFEKLGQSTKISEISQILELFRT